MARAFRLAPRAVLRHIVAPHLVPFLFGATRYGLGLAWKATVVAELVSQQDGVGYIFGKWFGLFQMPQVLAWTATFVLLMLATEAGVVRPLEAGLTRWRREVRL
jgi:NitT/TauT family transport system permease protein